MSECDECNEIATWSLCDHHEQRYEKGYQVIRDNLKRQRIKATVLQRQLDIATEALSKIYGPVAREAIMKIREVGLM